MLRLRRLQSSAHAWGSGHLPLPATALTEDRTNPICPPIRETPCQIPSLRTTNLHHASTSSTHHAFLRADGHLLTSGINTHGQLGHSDLTSLSIPRLVAHLPIIQKAHCAPNHTIALSAHGTVHTFGSNAHGQLGRETARSTDSNAGLVDALLNADVRVVDVGAGGDFSVAVAEDGRIFTWGFAGGDGRLGHGDCGGSGAIRWMLGGIAGDEMRPRLVRGLEGFKARKVFCGMRHVVAVAEDGSAVSWGCGRHFQTGVSGEEGGKAVWEPRAAFDGVRIADVGNGGMHSLVVDGGGRLYGVGIGEDGCLGGGTDVVMSVATEIQVGVCGRVLKAAAGWNVSAVVLIGDGKDGTGDVVTWGCAEGGALGWGGFAHRWRGDRVGVKAKGIAAAGRCVVSY